ncbi:MAG: methyltransferase domain-containing protein [Elainella sp.]
MGYTRVQDHQSMVFDAQRNQAYAAAMAAVITPESIVLDLGAGLGIHGLLAARLGAKRVYLVEPEDVIAVAAELVRANGFDDRIHCLQGKIEQVELPEKVDVILSVLTGNFLLEEDLLPSLFWARDRYLKPGGTLIPQAAVLEAAPIQAPELYEREVGIWLSPHLGLDQSPVRDYAAHSVYYYRDRLAPEQYLAEPACLMNLDFYHCDSAACAAQATYKVQRAGICHGWSGWFRIQLGESWLSTAPDAPPTHWSAAFLPLDPPLSLDAGAAVEFSLLRPPLGDWTWQVRAGELAQQHSTFYSLPMTVSTMRKKSSHYSPRLNRRGEATLKLLAHSSGNESSEQLSHRLLKDFPDLFTDLLMAMRFVRDFKDLYL